MNSTSSSSSQNSWLSQNIDLRSILFIFLILSLISTCLLLCICFIKRLLRDIQKNTLRIPQKLIPFSQKLNEKTHFQAMTVHSHDDAPTITNNSLGANGNESIDLRKMQEELYEKEEKAQKCEIISAIDINISDL